jgi:hypothetical protein
MLREGAVGVVRKDKMVLMEGALVTYLEVLGGASADWSVWLHTIQTKPGSGQVPSIRTSKDTRAAIERAATEIGS